MKKGRHVSSQDKRLTYSNWEFWPSCHFDEEESNPAQDDSEATHLFNKVYSGETALRMALERIRILPNFMQQRSHLRGLPPLYSFTSTFQLGKPLPCVLDVIRNYFFRCVWYQMPERKWLLTELPLCFLFVWSREAIGRY